MATSEVVFSIHAKSKGHHVYKEIWEALIGETLWRHLRGIFVNNSFAKVRQFAKFVKLLCCSPQTSPTIRYE